MIGLALLLLTQSVVIPAEPSEMARPATGFECTMIDPKGTQFTLRGTFPLVPAGSDPNRGMPSQIEGDGPSELLGAVEMRPLHSTADYRRFYVIKRRAEGGHFNMMFLLLKDDTGTATIDLFAPATATGVGKRVAVANGDCEASFVAKNGRAGVQ